MINFQKRLAFFLPDLEGGGAQRVVLNLIKGIVQRDGYSVDLVLAQAKGPYLPEVPKAVRLVDLKTSRAMFSLLPLIQYLRCVQPEALLSAAQINIIAVLAKNLTNVSTRVIVTEHSVLSQVSQTRHTWRGRHLLPYLRRIYRWADGVVAVSEGAADHLAKVINIPREKIQVIYNPVIMSELQQRVEAPLDHPWFKPNAPPVLLAVGRLDAVKDFSTLIRAFAQVRRVRTARLLILGEGAERSALESLIKQLKLEEEVSLPGFVDNPYAYLTRASLFVLSSKSEALPTVLIEALYCGLPCVATDCPGGVREITANGRYGQLVPVGDPVAMSQAILNVLDGKFHSSLPLDGLHLFKEEVVINQYLDILLGKPCAQ